MVPNSVSEDCTSAQVADMASLHVQLTFAPEVPEMFQCATNPDPVTLPSEVKTTCKYPEEENVCNSGVEEENVCKSGVTGD